MPKDMQFPRDFSLLLKSENNQQGKYKYDNFQEKKCFIVSVLLIVNKCHKFVTTGRVLKWIVVIIKHTQ